MSGYEVGQRVWLYDINGKQGPTEGRVTKVGRALVTVADGFDREAKYRIDTGQKNDPLWGSHYWIKTDEQRDAHDRREQVEARLRAHGMRFDHGVYFSTDVLEQIASLLDAVEPSP